MPIPLAFRSTCPICFREIDVRNAGIFRKVTGWVDEHRAQGGPNSVFGIQRLSEWAHDDCVKHPGQDRLFDPPR